MNDSLKNYKGTIFDLRNYPKHFEHWELLRYLIPTQVFCYSLVIILYWSHLGTFYKEAFMTKCPDKQLEGYEKYTDKKVILINEATISKAEAFLMIVKILIGTPAYRTNGNAIRSSLQRKINISYSSLGFYFSDRAQMQRIGIIPDIEIYPTMEYIMAGRDEVFETALYTLMSYRYNSDE